MKDEWWLKAAISNDNLVADLLLHLKDSPSPSPSPTPSPSPYSFLLNPLPPSWGLRQPRSKPSSTSSSSLSLSPPDNINNNNNNSNKKIDNIRRSSPTTPLSWTCVGDGYCEESSDRFRSKISAASDTPTTSSKRPRKKKTFAELKEEESSLLKERSHLEKELATLHMTLEEQRSLNENLKRIKLDLQVDSGMKSESKSDPEKTNSILSLTCEASSSTASKQVKVEDASQHLRLPQSGASSQEPVFALPDLNMVPDEECDLLGMS